MPNHTALVGDIKGSRDLDNWPEVFGKLKETLDEVNRRYAEDILIEFKPTVGDEFQGVLKTPRLAFNVYTLIKASLPVDIYCGMGVGEVEKSREGDSGLRGTAFYRARKAIELCKNEHLSLLMKSTDSDFADGPFNVILRLIHVIEKSYTGRQREIVNYHRLNPDLTTTDIAKHFKITQPTVSKILTTTNRRTIEQAEHLLKKMLKELIVL